MIEAAKVEKGEARPYETYLDKKGLMSWLFTLDHKRIGLMYLAISAIFFLVGGLFALIFRTELMFPGKQFLSPYAHNVLFTLHGALLIFMVIIPMIPAGFGNFFLPIMVGAKDVAFPRLNLMSVWLFAIGGLLLLLSLLFGPIDTGWTFYTPYSASKGLNVFIVSLAVFILGMSSILTGLNFIVTTHKLRAKGGFFDPRLGGDPVLFQHLFWFYSHPAVYLMILPAFGVVSEVVSIHSRKHIFGYWFIAASSLAIAFIGFIVWGHHMFTAGMSPEADILFSFLTFFVAVPTAVKIFNWVATMYKGKIRFTAPMLYIFAFLFIFLVGGLTGLFLASVGTDIHLHDTYFVVAHFHFTMVGAAVFAIFAAFFHWLPEFWPYHFVSTIGAFMIATGVLISFGVILHAILKGRKASDNPWGGMSLEWKIPSPPPTENFLEEPVVTHGPYDFGKKEGH